MSLTFTHQQPQVHVVPSQYDQQQDEEIAASALCAEAAPTCPNEAASTLHGRSTNLDMQAPLSSSSPGGARGFLSCTAGGDQRPMLQRTSAPGSWGPFHQAQSAQQARLQLVAEQQQQAALMDPAHQKVQRRCRTGFLVQ